MATHFQRYPSVGALTGELTVQRPYRTFLTAVQFCEWKVSHLLQKPIESVCGFLTVLPGAFCAFRWAAVEVRALDWFAPLPLPMPPSLGEAGVPCPSSGPADPFAWVASDGPAWAATRVILCADCVYDTAATRALFRTMEAIMRAAGGAYGV